MKARNGQIRHGVRHIAHVAFAKFPSNSAADTMQKEHLFKHCPETKVKSTSDNCEMHSVLTENPSSELESTLVAGAERELVAFITAVYELFGGDHSRLSVEIWMQELESAEWPPDEQIPDWRQLSIRAAARVAASIGPTIQNRALKATPHEQTFESAES